MYLVIIRKVSPVYARPYLTKSQVDLKQAVCPDQDWAERAGRAASGGTPVPIAGHCQLLATAKRPKYGGSQPF